MALALAGCTDLPDLGSADAGAPPPLIPLDPVLAEAASPNADTSTLDARTASLSARAAILRRPLTSETAIDTLRNDLAAAR